MIIGLCGFINAGKGSVADLLVQQHGYLKESFASSPKDAVSAIFGWDRSLLEGDTHESRVWRETQDVFWSKKFNKPFSPRLALQLMGTEAGRDVFHKDLWVHTVERRCDPSKNYVIADVRFPNEIEAIQNMGGIIVRVRRGDDPHWFSDALTTNLNEKAGNSLDLMRLHNPEIHYSEWAWIGCNNNVTITNDSSLEELVIIVDKLAKMVYNNVHVEANEDIDYETF